MNIVKFDVRPIVTSGMILQLKTGSNIIVVYNKVELDRELYKSE